MLTAQARPYTVAGSGIVYTGPCTYRGCALRATVAGTVRLWDNTSASGTLLAAFEVAVGSTIIDPVPDGVRCDVGIYVEVVGATVQGSVRVG